MKIYDIAFWAAFFFLCGIALGSFFGNELFLVVSFVFCVTACCCFFKKYELAILSLVICVGFFYFLWFQSFAFQTNVPFGEMIQGEGRVFEVVSRDNSQALNVELYKPFYGNIQIVVSRSPEFFYGDVVSFEGKVDPPEGDFAGYYIFQRLLGSMVFPKIERISEGVDRV